MTTRHTITHADEIYVGNAFDEGYSPDGRRGARLSHTHAHEFLSTAAVPPIVEDPDGILDSYATPSLFGPTVHAGGTGANLVPLCTGVLTLGLAASPTVISLDVARNITVLMSGATLSTLAMVYIGGRDINGNNIPFIDNGNGAFLHGFRGNMPDRRPSSAARKPAVCY